MERPALQLAAELRADGRPLNELARGARAGDLYRVRRGAYVNSDGWQGVPAHEQHRLAIDAVDLAARIPPVFSHESAAAVWGIPIVCGWPTAPRVSTPPG